MRTLLINASPRGSRSNSLKLAEAFVRGLGEVELERVDLCDLRIEPCRGCFACWKATPGTCCIRDDMARVIELERAADLVVLSFPLYYFNVPGPLKIMIDRQLPTSLPFMADDSAATGSGAHPLRYPEMARTRYVAISTCGFYTAESNYDAVARALDHWPGAGVWDAIFCGQGELFSVPELSSRTDAYLALVERAGAEYAAGGISEGVRAALAEPLFVRETFERMADASWGVDERGECEDEAVSFTRQMAALYDPSTWDGHDRVLEMRYRDRGVRCQVVLGREGSRVLTEGFVEPTTIVDTPWDVWRAIARGEMRGDEALGRRLYTVEGDFGLMMSWDSVFGAAGAGGADAADAPAGEAAPAPGSGAGLRPPSMATMLVAWIVLWVAVGVDAAVGPVVSLAVCALLPLAMARHELCLYDRISLGVVGGALGGHGRVGRHRPALCCELCGLWPAVAGICAHARAVVRGLRQVWLRWRRRPRESHLHAGEPHPGRGMGRAVPAHRVVDGAAWRRVRRMGASRCQQCGHSAHGRAHRLVRAPLPGVGCLGQGPARAVLGLGRGWRADWGGVCVRCLRYHVFYRIKLA